MESFFSILSFLLLCCVFKNIFVCCDTNSNCNEGFSQISANSDFVLALRCGTVYAWVSFLYFIFLFFFSFQNENYWWLFSTKGNNDLSQLGFPTSQTKLPEITPIPSTIGKTIKQITTGYSFSLALDDENVIYSWGSNVAGLGINTIISTSSLPTRVEQEGVLKNRTIIQISAKETSAFVLDSAGLVYSWG